MSSQSGNGSRRKPRIVIVGGGTAGWMSAAYICKMLGTGVEVHLIESAQVGTIGVGEATFSTIQLFLETLGLEEKDWMPSCNATYKLAIRFVNWNARRETFYHPFQRLDTIYGRNLADWWLKLGRGRSRVDYDCFVVPALCDAKRAPRYFDGTVFDPNSVAHYTSNRVLRPGTLDELRAQFPYGYHFDAKLFALFLSGVAQRSGALHTIDNVSSVVQQPDGSIAAIVTEHHGRIDGDLFIDCTGFKGLLINGVLEEPFISFGDSLLCDRAVALSVQHDEDERDLNPYTQATAMNCGWIWEIPLWHRMGAGYVYSSRFASANQAEEELRRKFGTRAEDSVANHIKMRVGRNRCSWVKNCVAIGLSSGFVEPLESTGIFFIQQGIEQFVSHFSGALCDPSSVRHYNQAIADCIDGVRDFLILHYATSTRADTPFWRATKESIVIPDELADQMKLWKRRLPTNRSIRSAYHGFEAYSYIIMLLGLGYEPEDVSFVLRHTPDGPALERFAQIKNAAARLVATLPSHHEYLARSLGHKALPLPCADPARV